jgi:hypothetical protein
MRGTINHPMKHFKMPFAATCLFILLPVAHAQVKTPANIACQPHEGDTVGTHLCTALRNKLAQSPRYEAGLAAGVYRILVTSETTPEAPRISVGAVAFVYKNPSCSDFIGLEVITTGADRVEEQATHLLAKFDEAIEKHKRAKTQ